MVVGGTEGRQLLTGSSISVSGVRQQGGQEACQGLSTPWMGPVPQAKAFAGSSTTFPFILNYAWNNRREKKLINVRLHL